jgi:hypothetical protein
MVGFNCVLFGDKLNEEQAVMAKSAGNRCRSSLYERSRAFTSHSAEEKPFLQAISGGEKRQKADNLLRVRLIVRDASQIRFQLADTEDLRWHSEIKGWKTTWKVHVETTKTSVARRQKE